jgi:hypothetical protein
MKTAICQTAAPSMDAFYWARPPLVVEPDGHRRMDIPASRDAAMVGADNQESA